MTKHEGALRLDIDITFSCRERDRDGTERALFRGTVRADGTDVHVHTDATPARQRPGVAAVRVLRTLADELADSGVSVTFSGPDGDLLRIGDVDAPALQRLMTRSRHVRLPSLPAAARSMLARPAADMPARELPPATPWPPVPTFSRRIRRWVTTTHSSPGSGRPRLVLVRDVGAGPGRVLEFLLTGDRTVIGSDESCDLKLDGLDPVHAEIRHDAQDEYVLSRRGSVGGSVSGHADDSVRLRTGSRIDMGPWRMVFQRAEFADHGRPHGGRQGGELSRQHPQYNPYKGRVENKN